MAMRSNSLTFIFLRTQPLRAFGTPFCAIMDGEDGGTRSFLGALPAGEDFWLRVCFFTAFAMLDYLYHWLSSGKDVDMDVWLMLPFSIYRF